MKIVEKIMAYFADITIFMLGIAAVLLLGIIYREEGLLGVWNTIKNDISGITVKFIPVIMVFFIITGALNHPQSRHQYEFKSILY